MKRNLLLLFALCLTAFNTNAQITSVSITGEAVGGWGTGFDFDMTSTDGENWTYTGLICASANSPVGTTDGGIKFRANHDWAINWGNAAFPIGTGTQGGANIQCIAGTYDVTFNSLTGDYTFSGGTPPSVVKLFGTAVSNPLGISMSTLDLENFSAANVTLLDGTAQFDVDGNIYGETTFPGGTLTGAADMIPVVGGSYTSVNLNIATGVYTFVVAPVFHSIALVGDGAGGWPNDPQVDVNALATTDGITYTGTVNLTVGDIKFRQDNAWTTSFGGLSFPTGPAVGNEGDNITVTAAGTYDVTFNLTTGAYTFSFPTIAIVGDGAGGWPNDPQVDLNQLTTTDNGATYTSNNLVLTTGQVKFRANNSWAMNWGGAGLVAALVQNGDNINVTAGTYNVTVNRATNQYSIVDAFLATTNFNASVNFKVYPNPSNSVWNFASIANKNIVSIQIVDVLGKTVLTINPAATAATVDASSLNSGLYFAKIATATATETVKLMKN